MISRFEHLKTRAIELRKEGNSLLDIETKLGIPRSTLSGWLRKVPLSKEQKTTLDTRWRRALLSARAEAVKWHNEQKRGRMQAARTQALNTLALLNQSPATTELALALLYLGEGMKKNSQTAMGNSDPLILKFFVVCLKALYGVPIEKIKCELHLRADQIPEKALRYWANALGLPRKNFKGISIDQRTKGRPTYVTYNGVCLVRCGRVDIQRKLVYIAEEFCDRIAAGPCS